MFDWRKPNPQSSDPGRFARRACVCGKVIAPQFGSQAVLPSATVTCVSPGCGAVYHKAHIGYPAAEPVNPRNRWRWRCVLCRAAAAMPFCEVEMLLAPPQVVHGRTGGVASFTWKGISMQPGRSLRLLCMVGYDCSITCQWPMGATLFLNSMGVAVPGSFNGSRLAPLLDVTPLARSSGENVLVVNAPPSPESIVYVALLVAVRTANKDALVRSILNVRTLPLELAAACMRSAFEMPLKAKAAAGAGAAQEPLSRFDIASVWAQTQASRLTQAPTLSSSASAAEIASFAMASSRAAAAADVDDDELLDVSVLSLNLRDPITRAPLRLPVRGDTCEHLQCFDLIPFITMNSLPTARWRCPVCSKLTMPSQLWLDSAVALGVLQTIAEVPAGARATGAISGLWHANRCLAGAGGANSGSSSRWSIEGRDYGARVVVSPAARATAAIVGLEMARYGHMPLAFPCCRCLRRLRPTKDLRVSSNVVTTILCPACGAMTDAPAPHAASGAAIDGVRPPHLRLRHGAVASTLAYGANMSATLFAVPPLLAIHEGGANNYNNVVGADWHAQPHTYGRHAILPGAPAPLGDGIAMLPSAPWAVPVQGAAAATHDATADTVTYCGPYAIPETGFAIDLGGDDEVRPLTIELQPDGTWHLLESRLKGRSRRAPDIFGDNTSSDGDGAVEQMQQLHKRARTSQELVHDGPQPLPGDLIVELDAWRPPAPAAPASASSRPPPLPSLSSPAAPVRRAVEVVDDNVVDLTQDSPRAPPAPRPPQLPSVSGVHVVTLH